MQIVIWSMKFLFWQWPFLGAETAFLVLSSICFLAIYLPHSSLGGGLSLWSKTMRFQICLFSYTELTSKQVVLTHLLPCYKSGVFILTGLMQTDQSTLFLLLLIQILPLSSASCGSQFCMLTICSSFARQKSVRFLHTKGYAKNNLKGSERKRKPNCKQVKFSLLWFWYLFIINLLHSVKVIFLLVYMGITLKLDLW